MEFHRHPRRIVPVILGILVSLAAAGCAGRSPAPRETVRTPKPTTRVVVSDSRPRRGQAVEVRLHGRLPCGARVEHRGRRVGFWGSDPPRAWIGIDLEADTGLRTLTVKARDCRLGKPMKATLRLGIREGDYPVQRLRIPDTGRVVLSRNNQKRVQRERKRIRRALARSARRRLWREGFVAPLEPLPDGGGFGARRILNGHPRKPHSGVDYPARTGTPVRAVNRGRVALAGELFFAGRAVYLDHGRGLFSLYYHLSGIDVDEGDTVQRGQILGNVGATGRVTGPHLHFAVRLQGARVDPAWLFARPPPGTSSGDAGSR